MKVAFFDSRVFILIITIRLILFYNKASYTYVSNNSSQSSCFS